MLYRYQSIGQELLRERYSAFTIVGNQLVTNCTSSHVYYLNQVTNIENGSGLAATIVINPPPLTANV